MLIDDAIEAAKEDGKLVPARPLADWAGEPRAFLMCLPLLAALEEGRQGEGARDRKRWAQLEADIGHFVEGRMMTEKLIKQLRDKKHEHWELISRRPAPSLRVFGRFAKPDVFVGTHVCLRKGMGGMWSPQFEHEKLVCEDHWKEAGLPCEPPPGAFSDPPGFPYASYITSNAVRKVRVSS